MRSFGENGQYRVGNHILHDHQRHGTLTFREVIEQSSNIGVTKIAQKMGGEPVYEYAQKLACKKAGIDIPVKSRVACLRDFGQRHDRRCSYRSREVGVTTVRLLPRSPIANNGLHALIIKEVWTKRLSDRIIFPRSFVRLSCRKASRMKIF